MNGFTPTPYPKFQLEWPIAWAVVGVFLFVVSPFVASVYMIITVPVGIFFCIRYAIDLLGAWADHKWGYKAYLNDRIDEMREAVNTPCQTHYYSTEDPSCPYLHADQSRSPV